MRKIEVCAAVVRQNGKLLLCRRPEGGAMAGFWEFPGGKRHDGESYAECLRREIIEELGVEIIVLDLISSLTHEYPDKLVHLRFYRSMLMAPPDKLRNLDGQEIGWFSIPDIPVGELLPADKPLAEFFLLQCR